MRPQHFLNIKTHYHISLYSPNIVVIWHISSLSSSCVWYNDDLHNNVPIVVISIRKWFSFDPSACATFFTRHHYIHKLYYFALLSCFRSYWSRSRQIWMTITCNIDQTWLAHGSRCQEKPVLAFNIVYCEESKVSMTFLFHLVGPGFGCSSKPLPGWGTIVLSERLPT